MNCPFCNRVMYQGAHGQRVWICPGGDDCPVTFLVVNEDHSLWNPEGFRRQASIEDSRPIGFRCAACPAAFADFDALIRHVESEHMQAVQRARQRRG